MENDNDGKPLVQEDHCEQSLPAIGDVGTSHVQFKYTLPVGHVPAYRAVFLIANTALGAGLLNFPQAYMNAGGIEIAVSVQIVLLIFIIGTFLILARCANVAGAPTYQDTVLFMLGSKVRNVVQIMIAVYFFGSAMTYMIIIGEQLSPVIELAVGKKAWYNDKRFCAIVFSLLFLLPLCIPRRLKALSYTSFFGGIGAFCITFVICYKYFQGEYKPTPIDPKHHAKHSDWKSAFSAIPVICFGFQCHVSSVAVYAELKNRSISKFFICALVAMSVCTITYSLSGSFGYLTFGQQTHSDILTNYAEHDTMVNVARVAIVFILLSSFAIVTFCARTVIDGIILSLWKPTRERAEETEFRRRVIVTVVWFGLALFIASVVPNIGVAIALIGGVASTFIFVFPGMMLLKTVDQTKVKFTRKDIITILIAGSYICVGAFIFGEVTTLALMNDIEGRGLY